ncbi:MAG: hypothetical protein WAL75_23255 [Terracidiphilus sp.]
MNLAPLDKSEYVTANAAGFPGIGQVEKTLSQGLKPSFIFGAILGTAKAMP